MAAIFQEDAEEPVAIITLKSTIEKACFSPCNELLVLGESNGKITVFHIASQNVLLSKQLQSICEGPVFGAMTFSEEDEDGTTSLHVFTVSGKHFK